jgi:hypothetical protein
MKTTLRFAQLPLNISVFLLVAFGLCSVTVQAQIKAAAAPMVQSTFYDAQALYYALKGYNAYPVYLPGKNKTIQSAAATPNPVAGRSTATNPTRSNNGPGGAGPGAATVTTTIKQYEIIELTTGKILLDMCPQDSVRLILSQHTFSSGAEKVAFISSILARNAHSADTTFSTLSPLYAGNTYLNWIFSNDNNRVQLALEAGRSQQVTEALANTVPDLGGSIIGSGSGLPTVNTLVEGLADFYIQRVNDEVDEAFFIHLQNVLGQYKELGILFPKTLASLSKISVTSYTQSLNALKSAYQTDLKNLLGNVSGLTTLTKYQTLIRNHPVLTTLFATCDIIAMVRAGKSVPDMLYSINNQPYIQSTGTNDYSSAVKLAAVISNAFVDVQIGGPATTSLNWITPSKLKILKNDTVFRLFMGLFAQNATGIKIGNFDFSQTLFKNSAAVISGKYIIYNFPQAFSALTVQIDSANSAKSISSKVNYYINIAGQTLDLANLALGILPSDQTSTVRADIQKIKTTYLPLFYQADSVIYHIQNKEYGAAIYAADTLVNQVMNALNLDYKKAIGGAADSLKTTGSTAQMGTTLNNEIKKLAADTALIHDVQTFYLKYGSFIAAIAEAQNPTDVKNAIQTFALPTGSSRIKKEHYFSWGINSYVGFYHSWNTNSAQNNMPAQEWGITAPIGIAVNAGHFLGGSITSYFGVIDIGAIFSYTASTNNTVQSQIKLGQILSPSAGLAYGFPIIKKYNIPLSVGANYQWGPELKNVDNNGNSVLSKFTGRFNIFLAIDLPMFNFSVSKN